MTYEATMIINGHQPVHIGYYANKEKAAEAILIMRKITQQKSDYVSLQARKSEAKLSGLIMGQLIVIT